MIDRQFLNVINAIRNFQPPEYYEKLNADGLKWILPTIGPVQFESQEYIWFRLYRHHCLFSFVNEEVDVDKAFRKLFDHGFDEYTVIVCTIQSLLADKEYQGFATFLRQIVDKAPWFIEHLRLTREQYKEELRQFAKKPADYKYCLRPSYSYPFIEYGDEIFLPTPHLLIQSITTAMMNRLTFGDDGLREKIGKNACEDYLFRIVKDSGLFDEVKSEWKYGNSQRTIDIMARKGNVALLLDSKLFSPKVSLRTYDEKAYDKDLSRIVEDMKQAYNHAHSKFNKEYYPFSVDVDEVYSLVVVYQEGYPDLEEIYKQTAKTLSIDEKSEEYIWLWHHVGFTTLANIERFLLSQTDILPEVKDHEEVSDKWLTGWNGTNLTKEVLDFQEQIITSIEKLNSEMNGIR